MELLHKDQLQVYIADTRSEMGKVAAEDVAAYIRESLLTRDELNIVFAAAPSQNEFLTSLKEEEVEWTRINAFHMDEYMGLSPEAPQRFGNFLRARIFDKVPFKSVHYLSGDGKKPQSVCDAYAALLKRFPTDIVLMGIGENGHIAFNDPHVALFDDPEMVKVVELDEACRYQQVHDKCFASLGDVPQKAYTLTIPVLMAAKRIFCMVPASSKAEAIRQTIMGEVTERCPASILRKHEAATLYCDKESARYLVLNTIMEEV